MRLDELKSVYFLGIGGIGMSAIARFLRQRGVTVSGYDRTETDLTRALSTEGMQVHYVDDPQLIPADIDLAVYTPAVPDDLEERKALMASGRPFLKRAEVLGLISKSMPTVAVAGTHGKTTTSTIIAHLLAEAGVACTALLGGIALNFGSNFFRSGDEWLVTEADEYDRSFLHLKPQLALILSADADHLDIYGDAASLLHSGYEAFARCIDESGALYVRAGLNLELNDAIEVITFGLESGDCRATGIKVENGQFMFDYRGPDIEIRNLALNMPGKHNVENAVAAISIALRLGLNEMQIRRGLAAFKGIRRRFEFIVKSADRVYIDDYAHHPEEIKAAIEAARMLYPDRSLTVIFQPHLFTRTRDFAEAFGHSLSDLDKVYLLPIYPAREAPVAGVSADLIAGYVKGSVCKVVSREELLEHLLAAPPEVLLSLGAGDIDQLVEPIRKIMTSNE